MADPKKALEELKRKYTPSFSREETKPSRDNKGTQASQPAAQKSEQRDPKAALESIRKRYIESDEWKANRDTSTTQKPATTQTETKRSQYYSQPELWKDRDRLYSAITSAEPVFVEKKKQVEYAAKRLEGLEAVVKINPRNEKAYKEYEQAYNGYKALAAEYETLYASYNQAVNAYNAYVEDQNAQYNAWRSTVRDAAEIAKDIEALDKQIRSATYAQHAFSVESREDATGGGLSADKAAEYTAELEKLQQQRALLLEEKEWAEHLHYTDMMGGDDFAKYSAQGAAIENPEYKDGLLGLAGLNLGKVGNVVTYSRDNLDAIKANEGVSTVGKFIDRLSGGKFISPLDGAGDSIYGYMTEDEVDIYNYLLAKEGEESAREYLKHLEEYLNARKGKKIGETVRGIDNGILRAGATGAYGLVAGVDQFGSGIKQFISPDELSTSALQYGSQYIREDLDDTKVGKYLYGAATTVGNMAPSILVSAVTGGLGASAAVAQTVGAATMGVSAAGNAYKEKLAEGYSKGQARTYSSLVGASEAVLQRMLGGIGKLGGVTDDLILAKVGAIDKAWQRVALTGAVKLGSEITEEELQLFLEPLFASWVFDEKYDAPTIEEMAETAIVTALSTGALEAGSIAQAGSNQTSKLGNKINGAGTESLHAIIEEGLATDPGSTSYALAKQLQQKIERGETVTDQEIGNLYRANVENVDTEADPDDALVQAATEAVARETVTEAPQSVSERTLTEEVKVPSEARIVTQAQASEAAAGKQSVPYNVMSKEKAEYGEYGKRAYEEMFEGEVQNVDQAKTQFEAAYKAGRTNLPRAMAVLNGEVQEKAYDAGRRDYILDMDNPLAEQSPVAYNGIENKRTEGMSNGTAEEVHLRNGGQRNGSAYPGGQVSAMEAGTGRNQIRQAQAQPADRGAASLTYGKRVSTASLGIAGGTKSKSIQIVTAGDTVATSAAKKLAKERGLRLVLFVGDNLQITQADGSVASVRAYISGDRVFVRADHDRYTSDQLMRHEAGHDMIAKGEIDPKTVRKRIEQSFGKGKARQLSDNYVSAYEGTGLTAEEIWEEVICDSLGDMNIFSGTTVEAQTGELLAETKKASAETKTESTRGPPKTDGKTSREVDVEFQMNFSGTVTSDRNVKLSNAEKKAIGQAIKNGNAHLDETGYVGTVNAGAYCYIFEAFGDGDAFVIDKIDHDELNIHNNAYGEANYGENRRVGSKDAANNYGQQRGRLSHRAEHFADGATRDAKNDRLAGEKPESERSRNGRKGEGTERDSLSDTYGPDYAHWRNTMKEGKASREVEYAPTFYSYMERVVEGVKQDKLGASSVVSMLRGKGVKAEEIKWSGIETFLEGKKSVTKQELLEFMRANSLQVEETELAESGTVRTSSETGEIIETWEDFMSHAYEMAEMNGLDPDDVRFEDMEEEGGGWVAYVYDSSTRETIDVASTEVSEQEGDARWGDYKLEGGTNYREYLFKMPGSDYTNQAMKVHWGGEKGVLAHARVQDFEHDGETVLFIEEIQSDWHNEGQKKGYAEKGHDADPSAGIKARIVSLREKAKNDLSEVLDKLAHGIIEQNSRFGQEIDEATARDYALNMIMSSRDSTEIARRGNVELSVGEMMDIDLVHQERDILNRELNRNLKKDDELPPEAPFSKNYHEFVLKNLLRKAAEDGYNYLAWTPGWMQEERWSSEFAEGYRIEYDQDIPKFLNKYGKQWGARTEDIALDGLKNMSVHAIPITDAMKQSVLYEGQAKFSREIDSTGKELTKEQAEYFKDSKVRDEQGNLKVMYHGTADDFTVFDPLLKGGKNGVAEGFGIYFADTQLVSDAYGGKVMKGYLNVTRPATSYDKTIKKGELVKLIKTTCEVEAKQFVEDGEYDNIRDALRDTWISNYVYTYDVPISEAYKQVAESIISSNDSDMDIVQEVMRGNGISDYEAAYKFYDILKDVLGVDGFITEWKNQNVGVRSKIAVVFDSNQFKNKDNLNPTSDPDVRFSQELDSVEALRKSNAKLKEVNAALREQFKTTKFAKVDPKELGKLARKLLKDYTSETDVDEVQSDLDRLYTFLANDDPAATTATEEENLAALANSRDEFGQPSKWQTAYRMAYKIAEKVISDASVLNDDMYQEYADLQHRLRTRGISLSKEYEHDIPGYEDLNDFRKRNFGRIKITKDGLDVNTAYQELASTYPGLFDEYTYSHPADQLAHIVEVLESMEPIEENPFSYNMREATTWLANDIMERFFELPQAKPTFADKAQRKVTEQVIKDSKKLERVREQNRERVSKIIGEYREKVKETRQKEKAAKWEAVGKVKEHYKAKEAKMSESRKAAVLRERISRHAAELKQKLLRPTDKKHIPQDLQGAVAKLLESINQESAYEYEFGKDALYHRVKRGTVPFAEPTKRTKAFAELQAVYAQLANELTVDPDLLGDDGLLNDVIKLADKPLADMTSDELRIVWDTLRAIEASVRTANKIHNAARWYTVEEAANALLEDNGEKKEKTELRGILGKGQKLTGLDMETPETFFHLLGNAGGNLFRMMRNAQDQHIRLMKEVSDFTHETLGNVNVRKLESEMHDVTLGGDKVKLSTAQIMELYVLSKRQQAIEHIFVGGILPDVVSAKGIKKITRSKPSRGITLGDVSDAVRNLTDEQRELADKLQAYASTTLGKWGNQTSMKVYGYEKFGEKNYWPIRVNRQEVKSDIQKDTAVTSLANRSFTKGTKPHANNSLRLGSIFDTFSTHASEMATYSAWLGTLEDINRIRNYTFRDKAGHAEDTVKSIIETVHGTSGNTYLDKLIADVTNGVKGTHGETSYMSGIVGNFKAAAVGANLRVIIQQPTAMLRAADMIGAQHMATVGNPLNGWKKALKYAPIAQWKDWGYFDINTGRQMKDVLFDSDTLLDKTKSLSMWGAGAMDSVAWGHLWNAVESEIKAKREELKPGTDAFYKAVAERFTEIVDHTQVVDGILQRSQIMRSADGITKMATSFMGEPTKQYNMMMQASYDAKSTRGKDRKAAMKKLARTSVVLAISGIANAMAQSIIDAVRDDDKEKEYWEKLLASFKKNLVSTFNPVSYVPFAKDILSILQGYDVSRMDMESIEKLVSAGQNMIKALNGEGKHTVAGAAINLIAEVARLYGIPVANLKREITSFSMLAAVENDNYVMQYRMEKWMLNMNNSTNRSTFTDILYKAYKNDKEAFEIIYADMLEEDKFRRVNDEGEVTTTADYIASALNGRVIDDLFALYNSDQAAYKEMYNDLVKRDFLRKGDKSTADIINDAMETRMKKDQGVDGVTDLEQRYYSPTDQIRYDNIMGSVQKSGLWSAATEKQRDNLRGDIHEYLTGDSKTAQEMRDDMNDARNYGIDETEHLLWNLALEMYDTPSDSGEYGSYNTREKADAIAAMTTLSDKEKAYLWSTKTTSDEVWDAFDAGVDIGDYVDFKAALSELEAGVDYKKGDTKSRKRAVNNLLDALGITGADRYWLYHTEYKK